MTLIYNNVTWWKHRGWKTSI